MLDAWGDHPAVRATLEENFERFEKHAREGDPAHVIVDVADEQGAVLEARNARSDQSGRERLGDAERPALGLERTVRAERDRAAVRREAL